MKKLILFFLVSSLCVAQEYKPNFKLANNNIYLRLSELYNSREVNPYWLNDSTFIYGIKSKKNFELISVNVSEKSKVWLDIYPDSINSYTYNFELFGDNLSFNKYSGQITKLNNSENNPAFRYSPDSNYAVSVKQQNLFITTANSELNQLSTDAELYYSFRANQDFFNTNEEQFDDTLWYSPNISWSPNSDFFIATRTDTRNISDNYVINSVTRPKPTLTKFKQRYPGEKNAINEIWHYNISEQKFSKISSEKWAYNTYWFLEWSADGSKCYFQRVNWKQTECDIISIDKSGNVEILFEEKPGANIFPSVFKPLKNGNIIWYSRRNGNGHLYLFEPESKKFNQFTFGNFNVSEVVAVSDDESVICIKANGKEFNTNPYYNFYYSVDLNTKEIYLLTPEKADHRASFSPDKKYFVDVFSRPDFHHKSVLRDNKGNFVMDLETGVVDKLVKHGWKNPEVFKVKASDNDTDLWGVMWKPFDFNPNKKYPVISYCYPGPQDNFVPITFFTELNNVHLAQYGFIVIMSGTRGSSYKRSIEFSEYFRNNLRDYPIEDNKHVITQLADKYDYIDLENVGIWGGSSGGYMAASSILKYPDFYKAAVARAGQHEPTIFHAWWSDIFNTGLESEYPEEIPGNAELAKNLKGKLLLIHGEADNNVHPANTMRLADALMQQGKMFDMLIVPGGNHGWSKNWQYVQKRIWLYFIEHLMNYELKKTDIFKY